MRRQSKEQDAAGRATRGAAADALAEAKCDFNGQGPGAAAEDKRHLSPSLRSGGQTKWYVHSAFFCPGNSQAFDGRALWRDSRRDNTQRKIIIQSRVASRHTNPVPHRKN